MSDNNLMTRRQLNELDQYITGFRGESQGIDREPEDPDGDDDETVPPHFNETPADPSSPEEEEIPEEGPDEFPDDDEDEEDDADFDDLDDEEDDAA